MRRKIVTVGLAMAICLLVTFTAFAGQWLQDTTGWKYQDDDGSFPINQWKDIDGKQYYFNENGYMLSNTATPDGFMIGKDGSVIGKKYIENPFGIPVSVSHKLGKEQSIIIQTYDPLFGSTYVTYNTRGNDKLSMSRKINGLKAMVIAEEEGLYDSICATEGREEAFKDFYRNTDSAIGALKYMEDTYGKESPEFKKILHEYTEVVSSQEYIKIKDDNKDLFEKYQQNSFSKSNN